MNSILSYIVDLFRQPALFLGFFSMIGLILQKKSFSDIIKGTLKTIIGVVILFQGVNILILAITPMSDAVNSLFNPTNTTKLGDFSVFIQQNSIDIGIVMISSFILNVIIARVTPFKAIFLTANLIFWFAMLFVALGSEMGLSRLTTLVLAVVFTTLYLVIPSNLMTPYVKELTGSDDFTIGHTTSIFCFLGIFIGSIFGDSKKSAENITLPKYLMFFTDTNLAAGLVMFIAYFIICITDLLSQGSIVSEIFKTKDIFTYSLLQGVHFSAGTAVLLLGSRMMLAELIPSFKGISDILAPGSKPALDVPMIFSYGMNSLVIGFLTAVVFSIITIVVLGMSGVLPYAIIPLIIACYFDVAPGAIFANKRGGIVAVILSSALGGTLLMVFCAISLTLISSTVGTFIQVYGGNDFSVWLLVAYPIFALFK